MTASEVQYSELLKDVDKLTFNIFEFMTVVGREQSFKVLGHHLLNEHNLFRIIDQQKYSNFLQQIYNGYRRDVSYHNDIHAIDVAQHCHQNLLVTQMDKLLNLTKQDILVFLVSAICHDFKHDGFTNQFHINTLSDRALTYNDISVQENYHVAQTFFVLKNEECNFINLLNKKDQTTFRKRMIECIINTDMAKHFPQQDILKDHINKHSITEGKNADQILQGLDEKKAFDAQQDFLNIVLHACDISTATRSYDIAKQWTTILTAEFFNQGDVEKELGIPVSFLCDRDTMNPGKSQIGFMNGIVIPYFEYVAVVFPAIQVQVQNAKDNKQKYEQFDYQKEYQDCIQLIPYKKK